MPAEDLAASKLLEIDVLREQYDDTFHEQTHRQGRDENRVFQAQMGRNVEVQGDGMTVIVKAKHFDGTRTSINALADIPAGNNIVAERIKARFAENTNNPDLMDFTRINCATKVTDLQLKTRGDGAIVDIVADLIKEEREDVSEKLAIFRNIPRSALIANVNGTPVQNDTLTFATGAATPTNTTGVRMQVDGGSIAAFQPGAYFDVYDGDTLVVGNIRVVDTNPVDDDMSVSFEYVTSGGTLSTGPGTLGSIANNHSLYLSGTKDKGIYSVPEWFRTPVSGDSFIGGLNRLTAANRWLIPRVLNRGGTARQISYQDFTSAARALNYTKPQGSEGVMATMTQEIADTLRSNLDANHVVMGKTGGDTDRNVVFGADKITFIHPTFGMVVLMPTNLHTANTVRILQPKDWGAMFYDQNIKNGSLRRIRGTHGSWYRLSSDTPGNGDSLIWKSDALGFVCDFCFRPMDQIAIENVTA